MTTDKAQRKERPIARGVLDYFPDAIAEVAYVSYVGNQQHNPGQEMHWSKDKSADHADCLARHLMERGTIDNDGLRHSAKAAWRALALLQTELESPQQTSVQEYVEYVDRLDQPQKPMFRFDLPPEHSCNQDYAKLIKLGCPANVAKQIVGGTTYTLFRYSGGEDRYVYIAGPMRGYENFNFPAFDKARDAFLEKGFNVISPADIDRSANPDADQVEKVDVSDQSVFVLRDFWANFFIKKQGHPANGIVLLDGWQKSAGATGEFFLDRWLQLKSYKPDGSEYAADAAKHDYALAHAVMKVFTPEVSKPAEPEMQMSIINPVNVVNPEEGDWDVTTKSRGYSHFWRIDGSTVTVMSYSGRWANSVSATSIHQARDHIRNGDWTRLTEDDAKYVACPNRAR